VARSENQDTFVIADLCSGDLSNPCNRTEFPLSPQGILLLVCDGMGGAAAGDLAARIAAEAMKQELVGAGPTVAEHPDESLKSAVASANGAVLAEAKAHTAARGMGTTCTRDRSAGPALGRAGRRLACVSAARRAPPAPDP